MKIVIVCIFNIIFRDCLKFEDEVIIDLFDAINITHSYCLNEDKEGSIRNIFKIKENMLDRSVFLQSNNDDPELLLFVQFKSSLKLKSLVLIGGEEGSAPARMRIYVNNEHPGFDLYEDTVPAQEIDCYENADGTIIYPLKPLKFSNVFSLTIIIKQNYGEKYTRIYYLGFNGVKTNKKKTILIGNFELKPLPEQLKKKDTNINQDLIYG